jgi:hypothetical protein
MAGRILIDDGGRALDSNANPSARQLIAFLAGASTPVTLYTTSEMNVAHDSPVVANSAGFFAQMWADEDQLLDIKIYAADDETYATPVRQFLDVSPQSALGSYETAGGLQLTLQEAIGLQTLSVFSFIPKALHAGIRSAAILTDPSAITAYLDGAADLAGYIQDAVDYLKPTGGKLLFPAGRYKIGSTIDYSQSGQGAYSAIFFEADGRHSTFWHSYVASGPLLRAKGFNPSPSGSTTHFTWGGGISGIYFDGTHATASNHDCIVMSGMWYFKITDCLLTKFRHGILAEVESGYNANPDYSASLISVSDTLFSNMTGRGIYADGLFATTWHLTRTFCLYCGQGGIYLGGAGGKIDSCAFQGIGWTAALAVGSATAPALELGNTSAITQTIVSQCEFDSASGYHIKMGNIAGITLLANNFIFRNSEGQAALSPPIGISMGVGGKLVESLFARGNTVRFDNAGTGSPVIWDFATTSSVTGVDIDATYIANSAGATYIEAQGYNAGDINLTGNLRIRSLGGAVLSPGKPAAFISCAVSGTPALSTSFATITYATADTLANATYTSANYYSSGVYTASSTGVHDVDATLSVATTTATDWVQMRLRYGGFNDLPTCGDGGQATPGFKTYRVSQRVFLRQGQTLEVQVMASSALNVSASGQSRLLIQMVD